MKCIFIEAMPVLRRVNPSGEAVEQADMIIFLQLDVYKRQVESAWNWDSNFSLEKASIGSVTCTW